METGSNKKGKLEKKSKERNNSKMGKRGMKVKKSGNRKQHKKNNFCNVWENFFKFVFGRTSSSMENQWRQKYHNYVHG